MMEMRREQEVLIKKVRWDFSLPEVAEAAGRAPRSAINASVATCKSVVAAGRRDAVAMATRPEAHRNLVVLFVSGLRLARISG